VKDLKIYYKSESIENTINSRFDKEIEKIAEKFGLAFCGSGVEVGTGIRDIHYIKSK